MLRLYKRLIFVLLLFCPSAFADGMVIGSAATCTEGSTINICTTATGQSSIGANAYGIVYTASGSYFEYGHSFRVNVASGSGVVEVRIGSSSDLTTFTAKMNLTVTNTDSAVYVAGQWTTDGSTPVKVDFIDTNSYYIGMVAVSGDTVRWQRDDATDPCASHSGRYASSGWNMNNSSADDWNHKSVRCN